MCSHRPIRSSNLVSRTQRLGLSKKPERKGGASGGASGPSSKNSIGAQYRKIDSKKGGSAASNGPRASTARDGKKTVVNGSSSNGDGKDEENKEEEAPEEERQFEASNHLEGDLVDLLSIYQFF